MAPSRSVPRVIVASLIGTSLEWYDFFLYGSAAALVFGKLFFPTFAPLTATLLAFTTYASIGAAAPILLVALRFVQGLGLGGEWGGAVLMSVEHADAHRRGFAASWPQVGVPAGNLLAAGVLWFMSAALSDKAFLSWGWRVPFLLSAVLVLVGLWIRLSISESPLFASVAGAGQRVRMPLLEVLRRHPRGLLIAMGARIGTDVAFYTFVVYVLTYITGVVKLPREAGLAAVLVGSAIQLVGWTGSAMSVSWYVLAMLAITVVALLAAPETANTVLDRRAARAAARQYMPA